MNVCYVDEHRRREWKSFCWISLDCASQQPTDVRLVAIPAVVDAIGQLTSTYGSVDGVSLTRWTLVVRENLGLCQ